MYIYNQTVTAGAHQNTGGSHLRDLLSVSESFACIRHKPVKLKKITKIKH